MYGHASRRRTTRGTSGERAQPKEAPGRREEGRRECATPSRTEETQFYSPSKAIAAMPSMFGAAGGGGGGRGACAAKAAEAAARSASQSVQPHFLFHLIALQWLQWGSNFGFWFIFSVELIPQRDFLWQCFARCGMPYDCHQEAIPMRSAALNGSVTQVAKNSGSIGCGFGSLPFGSSPH